MKGIKSLISEYRHALGQFSSNAKAFLAVNFSFQLGINLLAFVFTLYLKELGYKEGDIGAFLSMKSLGAALIALPASFLMMRMKNDLIPLIASFLLYGFATAAQIAWVSPDSLAITSFFVGAFGTVVGISTGPFLLRNSSPAERVHLFSMNGACVWIAATLGNGAGFIKDALVGFAGMGNADAYRVTMALAILFMAIAFALGLRLKRASDSPSDSRSASLPSRVGADASEPSDTESLGGKRLVTLFFKLLVPGFLVGLGAGLTIPFVQLFFKSEHGLGDSWISLVVAAGQACTFMGIALGPALARRKGKAWVIFATQGLSVPFILVITYAAFFPFVAVAYMARQALMNMSTPISDNFALEKVPVRRQHLLNALRTFLWTASWAVAAFVSGHFIETQGYAPSFTLTAALYGVSTVLFGLFWRHEWSKPRDLVDRPAPETAA